MRNLGTFEGLAAADENSGAVPQIALSEAEKATLLRLCYGWQNKEIAGDLGISCGVVRNRIYAICRALGVHNRAELLIWVMQRPALTSEWVERTLHPIPCHCGSPHCARIADGIRALQPKAA